MLEDLFGLRGQSAVVTGGAGLLGREFCRTLVAAGAKVAIADLNPSAGDELARRLVEGGGTAISLPTDVTKKDSVEKMAASVLEAFGTLDILVNCAAVDPKFGAGQAGLHRGRFEDFPLEDWNRSLEVNVTGTFLATQAACKPMLQQGRGVVVNLCSTYGLVGPDQRIYEEAHGEARFKPGVYSVSKAGVLGLTRYLAAYFAGQGIRVNALTPGGVQADHAPEFQARYSSRTMLGRMARPDELNGALLFLVSQASSYMTGANLVVDGGWTAW